MIILDISRVALANLMVAIGNHTNIKIETDLIRHMILNTIRALNIKFRAEYGELVVACDDGRYWRKQIFPYYKAHRKRDRDASELDWAAVFEAIAQIKLELKEFFPYRVVQVEHAEADDIIATLVMKYGDVSSGILASNKPKILIVSADGDFKQLLKYDNVRQYDPIRKKFLTCPNPIDYLKEHIIRGDAGDGVPNIMSQDDSIINKIRQKPIRNDKMDGWLKARPEDFCDELMLRNFKRNEELIDLSKIPADLQSKILDTFDAEDGKTRSKMFNFFVQHRLKQLLSGIQDF